MSPERGDKPDPHQYEKDMANIDRIQREMDQVYDMILQNARRQGEPLGTAPGDPPPPDSGPAQSQSPEYEPKKPIPDMGSMANVKGDDSSNRAESKRPSFPSADAALAAGDAASNSMEMPERSAFSGGGAGASDEMSNRAESGDRPSAQGGGGSELLADLASNGAEIGGGGEARLLEFATVAARPPERASRRGLPSGGGGDTGGEGLGGSVDISFGGGAPVPYFVVALRRRRRRRRPRIPA